MPTSLQRRVLRSGSVADSGEKEEAVPPEGSGGQAKNLFSSKRRGRRQEFPPTLTPRTRAPGPSPTHPLCLIQPPSCKTRGDALPVCSEKENSSVPSCTCVSRPITKQTQRRTQGHSRRKKEQALWLATCSFAGK